MHTRRKHKEAEEQNESCEYHWEFVRIAETLVHEVQSKKRNCTKHCPASEKGELRVGLPHTMQTPQVKGVNASVCVVAVSPKIDSAQESNWIAPFKWNDYKENRSYCY